MITTVLQEDLLKLNQQKKDKYTQLVAVKPKLLDELMEASLSDIDVVAKNAAQIVANIANKRVELIRPYLAQIQERLPHMKYDEQKGSFEAILTKLN